MGVQSTSKANRVLRRCRSWRPDSVSILGLYQAGADRSETLSTLIASRALFRVRRFTHTASQSIAVKLAFVGDRLALKASVAGIGDSLTCNLLRTLPVMLWRIFLTTPPCFHHNFVGLVAELGGDLPMGGQYLGRRVNLLAVTGRVRGDLRGLSTYSTPIGIARWRRWSRPKEKAIVIPSLCGSVSVM
jgi:hypothetical protein